MPFDARKLRVERFAAEVGFSAAYRFWSLRGVLAERWAYGPTFGAYREAPDQVFLSPAEDSGSDRRIEVVYGLRGAGIFAEGSHWTAQAPEIAGKWMKDVYAVFEPPKTMRLRAFWFLLYPVKDPYRASAALRADYYNDEKLRGFVPDRFRDFHAAVEFLAPDVFPELSVIAGVVGPPHRYDKFFLWPDPDNTRSDEWFMGMRFTYSETEEDGVGKPLERLSEMLETGQAEVMRVARTFLPSVVS